MKNNFALHQIFRLAALLFVAPIGCFAQGGLPSKATDTQRASNFLVQVARQLDSPSVPKNWEGFSEFDRIKSSSQIVRIGYLSAMVFQLDKTEGAAIPKIRTSDVHAGFALAARSLTLAQLRKLIPVRQISSSEKIIQDYLDNELSDIGLIGEGRLRRETYEKGREYRDSKRLQLLGLDQEAVAATIHATNTGSAVSLINRMFALAAMQACAANIEICATLE